MQQYYTTAEAANLLGYKHTTLEKKARAGTAPVTPVKREGGNRWWWPKDEVDHILRGGK